MTPPKLVDLTLPSNPPPTAPEVSFAEATREPECHSLLERDGAPLERLNLGSPGERAMRLEGCGAEAWRVMPDGRLFIAYATTTHTSLMGRPVDLRVVAYDAAGKLRWSALLDRSTYSETFRANFRDTFIEPLPPLLLCAGTLWQPAAQVVCVEEATGKVRWRGALDFWSGISPVGLDKSLFVADMTGVRRHYPFTGVEQRFKPLSGPGGRAAFYATDGERLAFSPNRTEPFILTGYDLKTLEIVWRRELPGQLGLFAAEDARHHLIFFKREDELWAIDAGTGAPRLRLKVGHDAPQIASSPDALFMLIPRADAPNLLHAVDPKTGEVRWSAETPAGTLRVMWRDGVLMIGSVRAIQRVNLKRAAEP